MRRLVTSFAVALVLLALLFAIAVRSLTGPPPQGPGAADDQFSEARARHELEQLLGDQRPHPVGSEANHRVRDRLLARLGELGMPAEVQSTVGCSPQAPTCAHVENVLASIPGRRPDGILLMAHYDSVPDAPGAGDDGAGVATLLEVARILKRQAPYENTLFFAFTDAEEVGLLGAEAFFAEHPWAALSKVVINVEGSGSAGPVYLLRAGPDSGLVVRAFERVARYPVASSFAQEVFKRMPNDTDFSVAMRAGKPGVDFAFAGERNHYHTPLDTVRNLDPRTLQHHGENVLPLVRTLASADLDRTRPDFVYTYRRELGLWLSWSPATGIWLLLLAALLLGATIYGVRASISIRRLLGGLGAAILLLVAAVLAEAALLAVSDRLAGTRVAWPANPWPWRLLLYSPPIAVASGLAPLLLRRIEAWSAWLGAWIVFLALTAVVATTAPLAGHLFLPAMLLAAVLGAALASSRAREKPVAQQALAVATLLGAALELFPLAIAGESTQGLGLAPIVFVPLAVLAAVSAPLFARRPFRDNAPALAIAAVALLIGLGWCAAVPLYSKNRPQHLVLDYVQDADRRTANVIALSAGPLPAALADVERFARAEHRVLPWDPSLPEVGEADWVPVEPPVLDAVHSGATPSPRPGVRTVRLRSARQGAVLALQVPSAALRGLTIEGRTVPTAGRRRSELTSIVFAAPPAEGIELALDLDASQPVEAFLADVSFALPEPMQPLLAARGDLAVPVHGGDRWIVFRRVEL